MYIIYLHFEWHGLSWYQQKSWSAENNSNINNNNYNINNNNNNNNNNSNKYRGKST